MPAQATPLSDLMHRLRTVGQTPPGWLVDAIREHGHDAVAPLVEIVREYPIDDPDGPEDRYWAAYNALQLLGDLRAPEAVEPILALLDEDDDWVDQYLPESLGKIGQPAIEPLRAALFEPNADLYGRARAANALVQVAERHPEHRPEIVTILIERFEADIPLEEPETLRGFLMSDLADVRAVEAIPLVRRAWSENRIDETIIGMESFRQIVERPEGVSPHEAMAPSPERLAWASSLGQSPLGAMPDLEEPPTESRRPQPFGRKVGRNESCPCGSGKKYKRCHGR